MARKRKTPKPKKPRTNRASKKRTRSAPDWAPRFLLRLTECGNISAACEAAAVGRRTVYERRDADADFAAAMSEALEVATDALELEARRRAHDGVEEPVFGSGGTGVGTVEVGTVRKFSDTLLIFLLKAHRPEKFRENVKVEHSGHLKHSHEDLSDAELDARIARLEADQAGAAGGARPPQGPR